MIFDRLFGSDDDSSDGCGGHHYGGWETTDHYRSDVRRAYRPWVFGKGEGALRLGESPKYERPTVSTTAVLIERRDTRWCQHEDCSSNESRWVEAGRKEIDDIVGEE